MRPKLMRKWLEWHASYREPCIVIDKPGGGKSRMIEDVIRWIGFPYWAKVNLALDDGTQSRGIPNFFQKDGQTYMKWIKEHHFTHGMPMAVFYDEVFQGQMPSLCSAAPVFWEKRVDDEILHKDSWIVGATNRIEDRAGVQKPPSHLPNRTTIGYGPDVSVEEWSDYVLDGGMSQVVEVAEYKPALIAPTDRDFRVVQFLKMKPDALSDFDPLRLVNGTPRQWEWVAQFYPVMPEDIRFHIISGRVGEAYATELVAFVSMSDQLPLFKEIVEGPKKAKVPGEPSALFLVTGMLCNQTTPQNFDKVTEYLERIPEEFQASAIKDLMRRKPAIMSTAAFRTWAIKFAAMMHT